MLNSSRSLIGSSRRNRAALSFEAAASVPVAGLAAWQSLQRARPAPGKSLLVTGGSGGVGVVGDELCEGSGGHANRHNRRQRDESRLSEEERPRYAENRIIAYAGRNRAELAAAATAANDGRLFDITWTA